jgi:predicted ArsR family transcriptional regulator
MQHTRQQIIAYLQQYRIATPNDLGSSIQVTPANIRHHLKILQRSGLVEIVGQQLRHGRGRPRMLYSLTENALHNNLENLASALLQALKWNSQNNDDQLAEVASHLLGKHDPASHMHTRLKQAVEKLNQMQYRSRWEASPRGPRIILRNCPYAPILDEHPELCRMDSILITRMLEQPFKQIARLERQPDGVPHCIFEAR